MSHRMVRSAGKSACTKFSPPKAAKGQGKKPQGWGWGLISNGGHFSPCNYFCYATWWIPHLIGRPKVFEVESGPNWHFLSASYINQAIEIASYHPSPFSTEEKRRRWLIIGGQYEHTNNKSTLLTYGRLTSFTSASANIRYTVDTLQTETFQDSACDLLKGQRSPLTLRCERAFHKDIMSRF